MGRRSAASGALSAAMSLSLFLFLAPAASAGPGCDGNANTSVAGYLSSIREAPAGLVEALNKFPKGADLHNHLSGALKPEDYVALGQRGGFCFGRYTSNTDMVKIFSKDNCTTGSRKLLKDAAPEDLDLVKRSLSMYEFNDVPRSKLEGHDQFFATFVRFGDVSGSPGNVLPMIATLLQRESADNVSYVETMISFRTRELGKLAAEFAKKHRDADFLDTGKYPGMLKELNTLFASDTLNLPAIARLATADVDSYLKVYGYLQCADRYDPKPGCGVSFGFQAAVNRNSDLPKMFTQTALSFMLADLMPGRVVGVNLVSGEDSDNSMKNFATQMGIFKYFHATYPEVNIALHGGELTPCFLGQGLLDPALSEHLTKSIDAGAKRLGHAVSFAYLTESEKKSVAALMVKNGVLIEVPFASNAQILGAVAGIREHPYQDYLLRGVPVAFATDDEGVSYSDFTSEWIYAVRQYALSFETAQQLARTSIEYSFLPGKSLWRDWAALIVNNACAGETWGSKRPGSACARFLEENGKARMQWEYEGNLDSYRARFGAAPWAVPVKLMGEKPSGR